MPEFTDDLNLVILEGEIAYDPQVQIRNGKTAYNFVVIQRTHSASFKYPVVYWEFPDSTPYIKENLIRGRVVRIRGHLQSGSEELPEKVVVTCKVCVDAIVFAQ